MSNDALTAVLSADTKQYNKELKGAKEAAESLHGAFEKIGAAVGVGLSVEGVKHFVESIASIGIAAERLGLEGKVKEFQQMKYAADQTGAGLDVLEKGMKKMEQTIGKAMGGDAGAQEKINNIGLAVADLEKMTPDQQFSAIAKAIKEIEDPALRTTALIDIFGKTGTMLLPMIENLEALKQEALDVGAVIDEKLINSAHKAEQQFTALGDVLLATAANAGLVKYLNQVAEGLLSVATNAQRARAIGSKDTKGFWGNALDFTADMVTFGNADNIANAVGLGSKLNTRYNVTDEEKKKLADFKAQKDAKGGKTKAEIEADTKTEQTKKVEEEKNKSTKKIIDDKIESLKLDVELQNMKNQGLGVEAQRLKFIADLHKEINKNRKEGKPEKQISQEQLANINQAFAERDKQQKEEIKKDNFKTIGDEAFKLKDQALKSVGISNTAETVLRALTEKGIEKTKDPNFKLDEESISAAKKYASMKDKFDYNQELTKFNVKDPGTVTNDMARIGSTINSVAVSSDNKSMQRLTERNVEFVKSINDLLTRIEPKVGTPSVRLNK